MLCDDWARSFSDTSILFIESNQYFAAALRHNPHHVGVSPGSSSHVLTPRLHADTLNSWFRAAEASTSFEAQI
jgi:hypothetical protein